MSEQNLETRLAVLETRLDIVEAELRQMRSLALKVLASALTGLGGFVTLIVERFLAG